MTDVLASTRFTPSGQPTALRDFSRADWIELRTRAAARPEVVHFAREVFEVLTFCKVATIARLPRHLRRQLDARARRSDRADAADATRVRCVAVARSHRWHAD
jgi:hypothetical protein